MSSNDNRKVAALKIIENPSAYKVCEGCDSIVAQKAALCPNCHSYRFDNEVIRITQQARKLGARDQKSVTFSDLF
jgi:RNA polymerase subunit RPABC4/transcription elongation factor Spt4